MQNQRNTFSIAGGLWGYWGRVLLACSCTWTLQHCCLGVQKDLQPGEPASGAPLCIDTLILQDVHSGLRGTDSTGDSLFSTDKRETEDTFLIPEGLFLSLPNLFSPEQHPVCIPFSSVWRSFVFLWCCYGTCMRTCVNSDLLAFHVLSLSKLRDRTLSFIEYNVLPWQSSYLWTGEARWKGGFEAI